MKNKMTQEEFQRIENESRVAKMFLGHEDFDFIRQYISTSLESIKSQLLTGVVAGTDTHVTDTQMSDLQAQYRWISKFMEDMGYFASEFDELQKAVDGKKVFVEGMGKKDETSPAG